jgi:hypothetical protein
MATPTALAGPRVRPRAPRVTDVEAVFATTASDPEVTRYLAWTTPSARRRDPSRHLRPLQRRRRPDLGDRDAGHG